MDFFSHRALFSRCIRHVHTHTHIETFLAHATHLNGQKIRREQKKRFQKIHLSFGRFVWPTFMTYSFNADCCKRNPPHTKDKKRKKNSLTHYVRAILFKTYGKVNFFEATEKSDHIQPSSNYEICEFAPEYVMRNTFVFDSNEND